MEIKATLFKVIDSVLNLHITDLILNVYVFYDFEGVISLTEGRLVPFPCKSNRKDK
jgi:hypothetical protein